MANKLQQVANRIKELREILEVTPKQVADQINLPLETYLNYESGTEDIPISVLYAIANVLRVDPTVLLTGDEPRMDDYTIVYSGKGVKVERHFGYDFTPLAYNYKGRGMEPLLVTLKPNDVPMKPIAHGGQEFNFVLEGTIVVTINNRDFYLNAGDCIYFSPHNPHSQRAIDGPAKFIAIIN